MSAKASSPDSRNWRGTSGMLRGGLPATALAIARDVLGRRAAASADNVHKAGLGEFSKQFGHIFRAFVVIPNSFGRPAFG